ncbi:MAG: Omp28-related outer membrane protein [Flavobacteriales bacterium]|nr:Omp28-related outer membrane protein [Flavobacteriales bacterium]
MKHLSSILVMLTVAYSGNLCNAQSFTPTKRVMVEDHTTGGAWFGWWSPRGIVYLEDFMFDTPEQGYEVACVHGNNGADEFGNFDAMYLPEYSDAAINSPDLSPGGWPGFVLDRKMTNSYTTETSLPTAYESISEDFGYANLTIEPVFEPTTRNLTVTVGAHFAVDADDFRLAVVLTEDSVHQPGVDGYGQTNAYNFVNGDGADTPMASSSVNFNLFGPVVPSTFMHFRHVARAILPSFDGEPGSLPTSVEADGAYSYTFPVEFISETFDENRMRAIVLLIDGSTGEVVNCLGANFGESQTSSIHAPSVARTEAKLFPNPATQTTTLQFMSPSAQSASMNIIDAHGRVADAKPLSLHQGTNRIPLDASQLDAGTYLVQVLIEGKIQCSKRLLVSAH